MAAVCPGLKGCFACRTAAPRQLASALGAPTATEPPDQCWSTDSSCSDRALLAQSCGQNRATDMDINHCKTHAFQFLAGRDFSGTANPAHILDGFVGGCVTHQHPALLDHAAGQVDASRQLLAMVCDEVRSSYHAGAHDLRQKTVIIVS